MIISKPAEHLWEEYSDNLRQPGGDPVPQIPALMMETCFYAGISEGIRVALESINHHKLDEEDMKHVAEDLDLWNKVVHTAATGCMDRFHEFVQDSMAYANADQEVPHEEK